MDPEAIVAAIKAELSDAHVAVRGEGCNFELEVISASFNGLTPVKRQQKVYACLAPHIESGALHAVSMKTLTPAQAGL
jgi:acid stress-induced BolA-like protein IbaG/YrbA